MRLIPGSRHRRCTGCHRFPDFSQLSYASVGILSKTDTSSLLFKFPPSPHSMLYRNTADQRHSVNLCQDTFREVGYYLCLHIYIYNYKPTIFAHSMLELPTECRPINITDIVTHQTHSRQNRWSCTEMFSLLHGNSKRFEAEVFLNNIKKFSPNPKGSTSPRHYRYQSVEVV
jgi:hypothetical protein